MCAACEEIEIQEMREMRAEEKKFITIEGRKIRLLSDNVIVELIHPERTWGVMKLIIPETAKREATEVHHGRVVAVGPGLRGYIKPRDFTCAEATGAYTDKIHPMDVKVGDEVVFYFAAGMVADRRRCWPSDRHRIIRESSIQGIIERDAVA